MWFHFGKARTYTCKSNDCDAINPPRNLVLNIYPANSSYDGDTDPHPDQGSWEEALGSLAAEAAIKLSSPVVQKLFKHLYVRVSRK